MFIQIIDSNEYLNIMKNLNKTKNRTRLSIDIDNVTREKIDKLLETTNLRSITQVITTSIMLLEMVAENEKKKGLLIFRDQDLKEHNIILLL